MQKKLLIAGGSHADIPIIMAAKDLGYWVITTGNNPNDLGHKFSDEYYLEDYSNPEKILKLAKTLVTDAICASSNDFSAISCAYTAQKLHLPGHDDYETALIIHHKDKFRKFSLENNILVPKAVSLSINDNIHLVNLELNYPVIVKPVDLSGGKGITKVEAKENLNKAIYDAFKLSKNNKIVIEEFIEGTNHGYSTFIKNGKVVFAFMDDEHYFINPYLVSGASTSLQYTKHISDQLNESLHLMASKLNLVDGLLHVQFILKDDTPYIIEICRRTPGDLYVKLVEYATGFNMSKAIVKSTIGKTIDDYTIDNISYIARHCVMNEQQGYIDHVIYSDLAPKIFDKMIFYTSGDFIKDPLVYKAEIDFIRYEDKEDMSKNINSIAQNIKIELSQ
ncbi:MAG TPA: ATP-grasp domain-containing protein [Sulfurovum sp.]|nr:ATP-grasp domain-containing protein [Sulfurovum sp.]